jgi:serine/threonine-protein kinase
MSDVSLSALERIDGICDRFEEEWLSGRRPRVAMFLGGAAEQDRPALRRELLRVAAFRIKADQRRRWGQGERVSVEEYLREDPALREDPERVLELVDNELALRRQRGESPRAEEYLALLPSHEAELRRRFAGGQEATPPTVDEPRAPDTMRPGTVAETLPANSQPGEPVPPELGHYRPVGFIGRGGVGDVFLYYDPQMDRDLAVKVLREEHRGNPYLVRRFWHEARIVARLQHPNVVPVHAMERTADGRPYFTMKLVKGRTLADLLAERAGPAQDLPRFLAIFEQVCQAVGYAHSQGVIHRDLKPHNVMVGAFAEVQVMDWGLGKIVGPAAAGEAAPAGPETWAAAGPPAGVDGETQPTRAGQVMGTLAYMAPEQARGEVEQVDRRSDVFGLGAILCEVLTGRPPFAGQDESELWALARACDHAEALARLGGCGADAELVRLCKACLAAEPPARPCDAGEVAQAVAAYQAAVQERLRAAERERAAEQARAEEAERTAAAEQARANEAKKKMDAERKARRRTVWLAAAVLLLGFLVGGWGLWWRWQQRELVRSVGEDLAEVKDDLEKWKIAAALTAMERVEGRVATGGPADLLQRVQKMRETLTVVKRLNDIRLRAATVAEGKNDIRLRAATVVEGKVNLSVEGKVDLSAADRDYAMLFAELGLAVEGENAAVVAARVRDSAIKAQLVAALDNWATATRNATRAAWLLEVARRAEPGEWSDRFRDPAAWGKPAALEQLAQEVKVGELSPQLLAALGVALISSKANAAPLLTAAQKRHPDDFWLNFILGNALVESKPEEAVGYYRAALAIQPETSAVHNNLGFALAGKGRVDEAVGHYEEALRIDPNNTMAHHNLGFALYGKGKVDEAVSHFEEAIRIYPGGAMLHYNLGAVLHEKGKVDEAVGHYEQALRIDPKLVPAHFGLGVALSDKGKVDEAVGHFEEALRIDPKFAPAHNNLGLALAGKGRVDEAVGHYEEALRIDPKFAPAHYNLGLALYRKGKLDEAVGHFEQALRIDPKDAKAHVTLGNALYEKGKLDEAVGHFEQALRIDPKLAQAYAALGQALLELGRWAEARDAARRCLDLLPQRHPWREDVSWQLQECERMLAREARLPALLAGKDKPAGAAECLDFARLCRVKKWYAAAARFHADAFAADPRLADDLQEGHRYDAACVAALAASQGEAASKLHDRERVRLREQALDWLRADLTAWTKVIDKGPPQARQVVAHELQHWQKNPDLAGLRDRAARDKLPAAERAAWQRLWADVDALLKRTQEK